MELNTLDESVTQTFMRDINIIFSKLRIVFFANVANPEVRKYMEDWDIWGPLIIGIGIAMLMEPISFSNESALVLIYQWIGSIIITLNCKLLGCNFSYLQMLSNLGYSSFPILLHSCIHWMVPYPIINIFICLSVSVWSLRTISVFLSRFIDNQRQALILFPCLLYFFVIGSANLYTLCLQTHHVHQYKLKTISKIFCDLMSFVLLT